MKPIHSYNLWAFSAETSSKLHILGLNSNSLSMNSTQIRILKQTDKICLNSLLKSTNSTTLEPQIRLEILCDFPDKSLEGELANEKFGGFLVTTDFSKSDGTGSVTMGFLDTACCRSRFTCCFWGELFARGFASGGFTCCLLQQELAHHHPQEKSDNPNERNNDNMTTKRIIKGRTRMIGDYLCTSHVRM